jgi:hypothetical protein
LAAAARAERLQQAIERGWTGGHQGGAHAGGDDLAVMTLQGREQHRHNGREQLAAQLTARAPHALERRQHLGPVARWAATAPGRRRRDATQGADRGFAVRPRGAAILVEDPAALSLVGDRVAWPERCHVLCSSPVRHDASFPVLSVTPVLRHRLHFR